MRALGDQANENYLAIERAVGALYVAGAEELVDTVGYLFGRDERIGQPVRWR